MCFTDHIRFGSFRLSRTWTNWMKRFISRIAHIAARKYCLVSSIDCKNNAYWEIHVRNYREIVRVQYLPMAFFLSKIIFRLIDHLILCKMPHCRRIMKYNILLKNGPLGIGCSLSATRQMPRARKGSHTCRRGYNNIICAHWNTYFYECRVEWCLMKEKKPLKCIYSKCLFGQRIRKPSS